MSSHNICFGSEMGGNIIVLCVLLSGGHKWRTADAITCI